VKIITISFNRKTMTEKQIAEILSGVVHPESGKNIVESGIFRSAAVEGKRCLIVLSFRRRRDPFAKAVATRAKTAVEAKYPDYTVEIESRNDEDAPTPRAHEGTAQARKVITIASGKGGVGKSTVTANLAVELAKMGHTVGVLDADIYGPSQPKLFGVEGYIPAAESHDGLDYIVPAQKNGVKIMSIGFFIKPDDALIWRGPMATNALKQLINQTWWGEVEFLLVDMPPGTGDVHLSVVESMKVDGAVVVSTPQDVATADVLRGIRMFKTQGIDIPVLGLIENMAWFTPAELPENKYYIFGRGGARALADREGIDFLGEIPLVQSIAEDSDKGTPVAATSSAEEKYYAEICRKIVDKG